MSVPDARGTHPSGPLLIGLVAVVIALSGALRLVAAPPEAQASHLVPEPEPMRPQAQATIPSHKMHLALVVKQVTPTPTYPQVVPASGSWRGVNVRFTVSGDARHLPDGSASTICGWIVWQRLEPIRADGRFCVTMPEGSVRGRFVSSEVCEGATTGWGQVAGQWCLQEVTWVAYPVAPILTSTPLP